MPQFHIVEVVPGTEWAYQRLHQLEVAVSLETFGEDQTRSAARLAVHLADEKTALKGLLLALDGPAADEAPRGRFGLPVAPSTPTDLRGAVEFGLPLLDNTHLVDDVFINVDAGHRRQGIGSALWTNVQRIAAERDRTSILGWSEHRARADAGTERVLPASGEGHLPLDGGTRFAQSMGLSLAQVERQSRLPVPVPAERLAALRAQAEARALPAYRVVSWAGPVPEEHLEHVAHVNYVLSRDAPTGEIDWEPEVWDAARVRHLSEREHLTGSSAYSLALTSDTGEVAGGTHLHIEDAHPERPEQWATSVVPEHRGHRLGLLLKVANLELLAATHPEARFVETWNAGENDHMLAINTALGYRLHGVTGAWQHKRQP
jgi:GNAT superfamily N-acetyltransferase